ncbi:hypothetical protein HZS61_000977 [Fusarium oxysporum f. sp. conglutinans]|uniref:PiggyBac transposable element-derived protein domain-containing protein n=1 Tax=Fusarium oxysporum f. sp. conglutinans TaxID=100902 RepID=A0A8H6GVR3_FUSOX|nr:hypothetical protein HZS61_007395 [Fusarium oxysporum f. sp. conglutinans]KAF6524220.1 hypothetical protein HZS61_012719 [Fusarium oxysporum f. sp. conglutinans]KAF6524477.1 hypothetical protein HZS61_012976 [Fusarium oxysporum f. sp. conglutinans]KAF6526620.1 hypothetical protein HZS61_009664 [Fusarium oxysporum f. sp. conglutinans]KAF6529665.1 hypothetical protein HZS61_000977 [Fusarium oxysporum f. sp. conglutinans]
MSSSKIQDYIDDHSFDPPPSRAANDPTGVPDFPPEEGCGDDFQPFNVEYRDFKINPLPKEPLELFQLFLFRLLRRLGYGATGTARPNSGITTEIKHIKETGKLPDGKRLVYNEVYLIPTKDKKVLQIAWKDSSVVLFLSTVHSAAPLDRTLIKRKLPAKRGTKAEAQRLQQVFNGDSFKMIPIPSVAAQYNVEMNHVDAVIR